MRGLVGVPFSRWGLSLSVATAVVWACSFNTVFDAVTYFPCENNSCPQADLCVCLDGKICVPKVGTDPMICFPCQQDSDCDDNNGDPCVIHRCSLDKQKCVLEPAQLQEAEGQLFPGTCGNGVDDDCDGSTDGSDHDCGCEHDAECDDGNPCTEDVCQKDGQTCSHKNLSDTAACDDGLFCTIDGTCNSGTCRAGVPRSCDDGRECTENICDEDSDSCFNPPLDATECGARVCDGPTLMRRTCVKGQCFGQAMVVNCDDGNPCTDDFCDAGAGCSHAPVFVSTVCDDGNDCTQGDRCSDTTCVGELFSCDDADPCTDDFCTAAGGCGHETASVSAPCNDGSPCTKDDLCTTVGCVGTPYSCDDDNVCTDDSCNEEGGCNHDPVVVVTPCDDANPCTKDDRCSGSACLGTPYSCDDGNVCTDDSCDGEGGCNHPAVVVATPCDDDSPCTKDDRCSDGECLGTLYSCDDGNICTDDLCDSLGGCSHPAVVGPVACNDGDPCTTSDLCDGSLCVAGTVDKDSDGDGYLDKRCFSGDDCDDNDPDVNPGMTEGPQGYPSCRDERDNDCDGVTDAGDPDCTSATCREPCNDGNPCTSNDSCLAGKCVGEPVSVGTPCSPDCCMGTSPIFCYQSVCTHWCNNSFERPADADHGCPAGYYCEWFGASEFYAGADSSGYCWENNFGGNRRNGESCTEHRQCAGYWCIGGLCGDVCSASSDCRGSGVNTANWVCMVFEIDLLFPLRFYMDQGLCAPPNPVTRGGKTGDTCGGYLDCIDGVCYPNQDGTWECRNLCCTEEECSPDRICWFVLELDRPSTVRACTKKAARGARLFGETCAPSGSSDGYYDPNCSTGLCLDTGRGNHCNRFCCHDSECPQGYRCDYAFTISRGGSYTNKVRACVLR